MSGRSIDINQCSCVAGDGPVLYRLIINNISVISFSIFCTQCLWDAVRSFLGSQVQPKEPCPAGLCEEVAVAWV